MSTREKTRLRCAPSPGRRKHNPVPLHPTFGGFAAPSRMAGPLLQEQIARCASWPQRFPPEQWSIYKQVMHQARQQGLRFAVGGGLAAMTYAGQWRNTKDIDLYVLPCDREKMIALVTALGLEDYYPKQAYDPQWIYRSNKDDT